jgi:hypothetical protein
VSREPVGGVGGVGVGVKVAVLLWRHIRLVRTVVAEPHKERPLHLECLIFPSLNNVPVG